MKTPIKTQAIAPGKLILSGEHAVVYGHPALAMAVNCYVKTTVLPQPGSQITFYFPDMMAEYCVTFSDLMQLKDRLKYQYQRFLNGELKVRDILQGPIELVQFALSMLIETLGIQLMEGISVHMKTDIPIGCGMGSSAAAILSVLTAVTHYLDINVSPELIFDLARQSESLQHGQSSGLDLKSSLAGGCLYFKKGQTIARAFPRLSLYLINTGQPQTSTGECVATAATFFKSTKIGDDFTAVTDAMDQALQHNEMENVMFSMRENHKLLNRIGVVPQKVQQLIAEIEQYGGAAKISGAGSVKGDHAGAVIVSMEDETMLQKVAERYQYRIMPIQCERRGVYVNEYESAAAY